VEPQEFGNAVRNARWQVAPATSWSQLPQGAIRTQDNDAGPNECDNPRAPVPSVKHLWESILTYELGTVRLLVQ